jgi:cobalt-zinc-cadmium efflux system protein
VGAHHGHDHGHEHRNARAVGSAALLTGGFMVVEVVGGLLAGSLALIADAGHMATDFAALSLAWLAFRFARRPADARRTYGFDRLSVLAAFVNGTALFVVAGFIVIEAARRLAEPHAVAGGLMLAVAVAGLAVNLVAFWVLWKGDRENLNLRAALVHVAGDLLGSAGAIAAALVILATGWTPIDPILSVLVALLILRSAAMVVRESAHILLEGTPAGFDAEAVAADLVATRAGACGGPPPARLVDHRSATDGDARGGARPGRRPRGNPAGDEGAAGRAARLRSRHGGDLLGGGRGGRHVRARWLGLIQLRT